MNPNTCSRVVLVALGLMMSSAFGQQRQVIMGEGPAARLDYSIEGNRNEVTVPIRLVGDATLVPVSVDGSREFWLTLDTGMPADRAIMLWAIPALDSLGLDLRKNPNIRIGGAGGKGEEFVPEMATGVRLDIGDLHIADIEIHTLPQMKAPYQRDEGVIGRMLFANFQVELDYDNMVMHLHRPGSFVPDSGWIEVPLEIKRGNPYLNASVTTDSGNDIPVYLIVDLGAGHALSLFVDSKEGIEVPDKHIETVLGRGISGEVVGSLGRIDAFSLGNYLLENVLCTYPRGGHPIARDAAGTQGNLGNGILKRFNQVFDYKNQRLLLKPNHAFDEPFETDMSGLMLWSRDDSLFEVTGVQEGSPAAAAGIQKGDIVVEVDGSPAADIPFLDLRERLRQPGETISLGLSRDGQPFRVDLKLERMI